MATAADHVILGTDILLDHGEIDGDHMDISGIFVDSIVSPKEGEVCQILKK
jgi:acyl CoA:acetate/3-ketoacid CoA transferase alpha subunit